MPNVPKGFLPVEKMTHPLLMVVRKIPVVTPWELFLTMIQVVRPLRPDYFEQQLVSLVNAWIQPQLSKPQPGCIFTLSVRTGFDAFLTIMNFPPHSEVLMSACTISDMPKIVTAHGLYPVPVDLDLNTLSPRFDLLELAVTPQVVLLSKIPFELSNSCSQSAW